MISVDLTKIKRFKRISKEAIKKFLHPTEIEKYQKLNRPEKAIFLATRWAIKECLFKIDNSLFQYREILIEKNESGRYIYNDFQLSTTNEDGYVVAVAFKN
ncbi:4'-phosphopantetheinyl transferase superfamily protein [Metamycoplasma phocicerebrale]|uniref:4'-phosphopantetheinyl transferase superfamily protein n=1 Tax=Metamycoplasma phocicerebrale TaxID=142649 RepID=A0A3T0TTB1_9BACT|nr:4'-phosphopantetheinyl transferase superfamily protein [Metamycoplasma phocicerebrale]AZZ65288.1 4'-phosphopantetheinyl transferase superfamily protein [Metamycoplasma phocicerebrale]